MLYRSDFPTDESSSHCDHIAFDRYLSTLARIYTTKQQKNLPLFFGHSEEWLDDPDALAIANAEIFDDEAQTYFSDVVYAILLRSLLEVVSEDEFVTLDLSDLIDGGWVNEDVPTLFDAYMQLLLQRIELDYTLYGFVLENDPMLDARLRRQIMNLNESQFIEHVLRPLFVKMGFEHVRGVSFHGNGEFGSDILPFRHTTSLGTLEYYALQAKAVAIHGTSSRLRNAGELISQAVQAFSVRFGDDLDNEIKRIDKFVIATSKDIAPSARTVIEQAMQGDRKLVFLDIDRVVELVKRYGLLQYVLFSDLG